MTSYSTARGQSPTATADRSDHAWGGRIVIAGLVLIAFLSIVGLAIIYWGDNYAVPAWDERSVPAPTLY